MQWFAHYKCGGRGISRRKRLLIPLEDQQYVSKSIFRCAHNAFYLVIPLWKQAFKGSSQIKNPLTRVNGFWDLWRRKRDDSSHGDSWSHWGKPASTLKTYTHYVRIALLFFANLTQASLVRLAQIKNPDTCISGFCVWMRRKRDSNPVIYPSQNQDIISCKKIRSTE